MASASGRPSPPLATAAPSARADGAPGRGDRRSSTTVQPPVGATTVSVRPRPKGARDGADRAPMVATVSDTNRPGDLPPLSDGTRTRTTAMVAVRLPRMASPAPTSTTRTQPSHSMARWAPRPISSICCRSAGPKRSGPDPPTRREAVDGDHGGHEHGEPDDDQVDDGGQQAAGPAGPRCGGNRSWRSCPSFGRSAPRGKETGLGPVGQPLRFGA